MNRRQKKTNKILDHHPNPKHQSCEKEKKRKKKKNKNFWTSHHCTGRVTSSDTIEAAQFDLYNSMMYIVPC